MGFNSVYGVLQEVFPQVDSRMLRAVAIEHSKDADTAVEVVLVEVLPSLYKKSIAPNSSIESESLFSPSEAVDAGITDQPNSSILVESVHSDGSVHGSSFYAINDESGPVGGDYGDGISNILQKYGEDNKTSPDMPSSSASSASIYGRDAIDDNNDDHGCGNSEGEEATSLGKSEVSSDGVSGYVQSSHISSPALNHGEAGSSGSIDGDVYVDCEDLNEPASDIKKGSDHEQSFVNGFPGEMMSVVHRTVTDTQVTDIGSLEPGSSFSYTPVKDVPASEIVNVEDESTMNAVVSRSGQVCSIDLLEDIIEDARNNKKTLVSAMDSVISLMREVECKEKDAEQAKEEAAQGCLDILAKVVELKQALKRAKEANDMHAGEVYAEKAILATEMKELQLRLLSLSEERDRSLGILDEMRKELEARLLAVEKEMEAVEQEKVEREGSAQEALAYQESAIENVVEESNILKRVAEENSKLQDFLMDRGRVVDMLQGEISVKCQDVKMLKENFDRRIPLNKFLSSSQTSSILASSSSSIRSMTPPEQMPEMADSYETLKKSPELAGSYGFLEKRSPELADSSEDLKTMSATSSFHDQLLSGEEKGRDDRNVLMDDGWELCDDNGDFLANK